MNRLRAHRRARIEGSAEGLSPDHGALVHALRQLPANQRRAVALHHLAGLTVVEIAEETGAPANTVEARLVRARRALALHLTDTHASEMGAVVRNA